MLGDGSSQKFKALPKVTNLGILETGQIVNTLIQGQVQYLLGCYEM